MANPENERRLRTRFLVFLGQTLGYLLLRLCYNTNRWEYLNKNYFDEAKKSGVSIIIASWHSTLLSVFMGLAKKKGFTVDPMGPKAFTAMLSNEDNKVKSIFKGAGLYKSK